MAYNLTSSGSPAFVTGKFGNALDTTNGYYSYPSNIWTNSGTIECWVKTTFATQEVAIGSDNGTWLGIDDNHYAHSYLPSGTGNMVGTVALNDGAWHHLAVTYSAGNSQLWVDGTLASSANYTASSGPSNNASATMTIGKYASFGYPWSGGIDEVRFSSSVRYSATFTPSASAFTTDGNTVALYHFNSDGTDATGAASNSSVAPTRILLRRGTASEWTSFNPVLAAGEQGLESDTNKIKIGDGSTAWTSLGYFAGGSASSSTISSNTQTANYTLALSDAGKVVEMNVATANTVTIPANASVAFPVGSFVDLYEAGTGKTTVVPSSGVTIRSVSGLALAAQYSSARLRQRATDEWVLSGSLTNTISDNFNRADNASSLGAASDGGTWTIASGTWGIASNQAYDVTGTGAMAVRDVGSTNHYVEYTMNVFGNAAIIARFVDVNNWYGLVVGSGSLSPYKFVGGGAYALSGSLGTANAGDTIRLTVVGTTLTVSRNGNFVGSVSDSSITTGTKVGMREDSNAARFDNFFAGPLT